MEETKENTDIDWSALFGKDIIDVMVNNSFLNIFIATTKQR